MALGQLQLPLNERQYFVVTGGPYMDCPKAMHGVKMAKEIRRACAVDIPTEDFQTPDPRVLEAGLVKAVDLILAGKPVYVGCMGGKGRTGLFLAILAKAFRVQMPVEFVRTHYYRHAVETKDQYQFVQDFPISLRVRRNIRLARWRGWLWFWKTNLTRLPAPEGEVKAPAMRKAR